MTPIPYPATFGAPYEGGFYGGLIRGHGDRKVFAIAWAPKALGDLEGIWLPSGADVPGASSCVHSMDNTLALAEAGSELAQRILALDINGKTDWCMPARDVLELGYRHLKPTTQRNWMTFRDGDNPSSLPAGYPYTADTPRQTTVEAFQQGGPEAFEDAIYLSSSQCSASAVWCQGFDGGRQDDDDKEFSARARACRLILL